MTFSHCNSVSSLLFQAFSGTIVENASTSTSSATDSVKAADIAPPKRVSKFKAQRQQMQQ
jgi:hypothetical protein